MLYGVCRCIDLKVQLTAVSAVLSQIGSQTIYTKTRLCFGRLGYTLLKFILVIINNIIIIIIIMIIVIIILTHGIAYYTVFIHAAPMDFLPHAISMRFHTYE